MVRDGLEAASTECGIRNNGEEVHLVERRKQTATPKKKVEKSMMSLVLIKGLELIVS